MLGGIGLLLGALVLSSCTTNFCSDYDKANIAYPFEQGVTVYCDAADLPSQYSVENNTAWYPYSDNQNLVAYIPVDSDGQFAAEKASYLVSNIISNATSNGYDLPSQEYWKQIDQLVLDAAIEAHNEYATEHNASLEEGEEAMPIYDTATITADDINPYTIPDCNNADDEGAEVNDGVLRTFGYVKFLGQKANDQGVMTDTLWANWDEWNSELKVTLGAGMVPTVEFENLYKSQMNNTIASYRSCIATTQANYGHYGANHDWMVNISGKDWNYAWGKGFLEGLIAYPVSAMVDTFAYAFDPTLSGVGQICALMLVTVIVRSIIMLLMLPSTISQQKMTAIQPQLAKLQAKYPNSTENKAEQARLTQEQMALYKRNKIHPFTSIIALFIQFPIFIAVWWAFEGSAVLSSGSVLNLRLSDTIRSVLSDFSGTWYLNTNGWWTALVLFLIMAGLQFVAMMLPQWINKKRTKNMTKLSKNPAQDTNTKRMKIVSYVMLIFTIIMGFMLPSAMGVYWAMGALMSIIQTSITQAVIIHKEKKKAGKHI